MTDNKMKSTKNKKKEDGTFHSKHIKHDPQAESARAVFGKDNETGEMRKDKWSSAEYSEK
ncbi:hypothetical protein EDD66_107185 [Mobilisporobacter senegalensis]|uniref:Uncharacterized protein n=1 Tax=Mobilisporobacter senegalensis TaxID=1329262 RepID=A0A3N1XM96_9FIRM|nr:CPC_1213 family protein [Mobilisporobacter senegalensis]ROR27271.1 hypothetical protein EDD66_107185 [Mobilisporobacter senegalensis]